jgi:periplasmic divalent cation tolerance protein
MSVLAATMVKLAVYYVTAPSREIALKLSDILLNQRLIACCNIIDGVQSVYVWQGKVENDKEVLMIMKSREELASEISEVVTKNHPY